MAKNKNYIKRKERNEIRDRVEEITDQYLATSEEETRSGADFRKDFNDLWKTYKETAKSELTPRQCAYLAAYSILGSVMYSAKSAGISPNTARNWAKNNEKFAEYYDLAEEAHAEYLEVEAQRRAVMGVEKDVWYQGEKVGTEVKYSDNLLKFLLQGARPQKYRRQSKVEVKADGDSKVQVNFGIPELNENLDTSEIEGD